MTFSFDRRVYRAREDEGNATLTIVKDGSSDYARSVMYTGVIQNGVYVTQMLTFSGEETMKEIFVRLVDDEVALEETEVYTLSLHIPTAQIGVELGQHPAAFLEVVDNDGKGQDGVISKFPINMCEHSSRPNTIICENFWSQNIIVQ